MIERVKIKKKCIFARSKFLPCGVMVAHRILVPFVWVRVLSGQQLKSHALRDFFLYVCHH